MKYAFILILSVFSLGAIAQQITYAQFKEQAKTEINLQPEYGNAVKTPDQLADDKKFVDFVLKQDTTPRRASQQLVSLGFRYLYMGDLLTAMRRFNQAWLLDHKNEDAYWGFGSVYFYFGDEQQASVQFEKGLLINPNSSNILTDKATIYMDFYVNKHDPNYLTKAINVFIQSYKIDPINQNTLFKLSAAYYYEKDCLNARKYYDECMKLGGKPITPEYTEALNKQCNR